jgi:hypothetical protein
VRLRRPGPQAKLRVGVLAVAIVALLFVSLAGEFGSGALASKGMPGLTPAVRLLPSDNNGSNNNSGGNGSFSLPSGLVTLALVGGLVFVVLLALIAGGVVALAVITSRRLRQINETLAQMNAPPKGPTPPT